MFSFGNKNKRDTCVINMSCELPGLSGKMPKVQFELESTEKTHKTGDVTHHPRCLIDRLSVG